MKKQRIIVGSILEIYIENEYFVYAQILENGYVFFDYQFKDKLINLEILIEKPILFIIAIYRDVITQGHWLKIGKLPIRIDLYELPMKFIQDAQNHNSFEIYNPNTGEIIPAKKEEIIGLERAAVWDKHHIEDRIRDYYNRVPCIWLKYDR
jgi:hypothetical protein